MTPAQTSHPANAMAAANAPSVPVDSVAADSVPADSVAPARFGLILTPKKSSYNTTLTPRPNTPPLPSESWVMLGMFILFAIVCLRIRSNRKYLRVLWRDLIEVRERHNAFDDTVKETSLLVLLNIFWCTCAGVLLFYTLRLAVPDIPEFSFALPALHKAPGKAIMLCIGIATAYNALMTGVYSLTGRIFSDAMHTSMWVKGFSAQQGLSTFLLFPLALLALCYPDNCKIILIIAIFPFIIGKFIFICKGFRIFFSNFTSILLFLYYLCSLEIVPLILTFVVSVALCSIL